LTKLITLNIWGGHIHQPLLDFFEEHHYTKTEKFADYVLTSPNIQVIDFQVLPDAVSDHSPLQVEFNIQS